MYILLVDNRGLKVNICVQSLFGKQTGYALWSKPCGNCNLLNQKMQLEKFSCNNFSRVQPDLDSPILGRSIVFYVYFLYP